MNSNLKVFVEHKSGSNFTFTSFIVTVSPMLKLRWSYVSFYGLSLVLTQYMIINTAIFVVFLSVDFRILPDEVIASLISCILSVTQNLSKKSWPYNPPSISTGPYKALIYFTYWHFHRIYHIWSACALTFFAVAIWWVFLLTYWL